MAHFFGTDGIRGPIATSPLLTPLLQHFGYIMTQWARDASNKQPHILLAQDTRASCQSIADALASGITAAGGICSSAGVMPTPALQCSISYSDQYDYGIMISASHNPASDNGIKVLTPHGKLSRGEEFSLSSLLSGTRPERHKAPPYMIPVCAENERRRYTQHICDFFLTICSKALPLHSTAHMVQHRR